VLRRAIAWLGGLVIATTVGTILLVRLEPPTVVEWNPPAGNAVLETRVMRREFTTSDSGTVAALQIAQQSRGTMVFVWGLGDPQRFLTREVGALADRYTMHVIGVALRGTVRSPQTPSARFAYDRDLAAVLDELKRREPSGPVILVGVRAGAGLVTRYVQQPGTTHHPLPDGLILVDPLLTSRELLLTPAAWEAHMYVWPRRARVRQALWWLPLPSLDRLRVARPFGTDTPAPGADIAAGALAALVVDNPWPAWTQPDVPTLLMSPARPEASRYAVNDTHLWHQIRPGEAIGPAMTIALDEFLAPFTEAATFRRPVPGTREVPILPP
jgi:alpha-beta hydrolase superfamily lysophospholipase